MTRPAEFYFIFAPNNSGTTVMSQYLADQLDGYLPPFGNFEGQFAPAVRKVMRNRQWNPNNLFDWAWIASEWNKLRVEAGEKPFVEASPPNMVRVKQIREVFDGKARYMFSISNPYLQVSSSLFRYHTEIGPKQIRGEVDAWLWRADFMRDNIINNPDIPFISYEAFCASPRHFNFLLRIPVRSTQTVKGKRGSAERAIRDLTLKNVLFLTRGEIDTISDLLSAEQDLMDWFGYEVKSSGQFLAAAAGEPDLLHDAYMRKLEWTSTKQQPNKAAKRRSPSATIPKD